MRAPSRTATVTASLALTASIWIPLGVDDPGSDHEYHRLAGDRTVGSEARGARAALAGLPLKFIENRGQVDPRARYYLAGSHASVWFTNTDIRIGLEGRDEAEGWGLALDFVGARATEPRGLQRSPAVISYFKGRPSEWRGGMPTFDRVAYRELWPGIDLVVSGSRSRLEYSFLVHPGANPSLIRLRWRGSTDLALSAAGDLRVATPARSFRDLAPVAFQRVDGRIPVGASYSLDGRDVRFALGDYDRSEPLVIDPMVLLYAGFIGGVGDEYCESVAVDGAGSTYVAGCTDSTDATFPETVGPFLMNQGGYDAFVAKVNPAGTALEYAGFIGGDAEDLGEAIAVDGAGNAYVTGQTKSSAATFPETVGPDLGFNGQTDAFVAKVNPAGTALVYAGYIGGSGFERGDSIAVDGSGSAYVSGLTDSDQTTFPVTVGPDLGFNGGNFDAFVAKVTPSGATLTYAGYIGGAASEEGHGVAVDGAGSAYVVGGTDSTQATFPETVGPDLMHNGGDDGFVAKVTPSGATLTYAGYIGGIGDDVGVGIALDGAGSAYLIGYTDSTEATFPEAVGPDLGHNGDLDAFVAKVAPSGASLSYAGYIGGSAEDRGFAVDVDTAGNAYVTGRVDSTEATFPVLIGPDLTYNGRTDAFVAKVAASGASLHYAGYIGGSGQDWGAGIAVDTIGYVYIAGRAGSTEATFPVAVGPGLAHGGGAHDPFVAKVGVQCVGKPATMIGTDGAETLAGTSGADVVAALGGNDIVKTFGGKDLICAGSGNDRASGGGGKDKLIGEKGKDRLSGGGANDRLRGGPGKDRCLGGGGSDRAACEVEKKVP